MARVSAERVKETKQELLGAAQKVLLEEGGAGISTRRKADAAGTHMSQIQYHFEQNFHVASQLERYNAGRKMIYAESYPERIAVAMAEELRAPRVPYSVAKDGAARAATMLSDLF